MYTFTICALDSRMTPYNLVLRIDGEVIAIKPFMSKKAAREYGNVWKSEREENDPSWNDRPEPTNDAYNALMPRTAERNPYVQFDDEFFSHQ